MLSGEISHDKITRFLRSKEFGSKELWEYVKPMVRQNEKSDITKNQLFRQLIQQACDNNVLSDYMLADNWYGSKANMEFIQNDLSKSFIIGIKSNRTLALSENDAKNGQFQAVKSLELEEDVCHKVWLKGLTFPVQLIKKVFKNENRSTGILYLISNDRHADAERLYEVYQKRWRIEEYHKSIKSKLFHFIVSKRGDCYDNADMESWNHS